MTGEWEDFLALMARSDSKTLDLSGASLCGLAPRYPWLTLLAVRLLLPAGPLLVPRPLRDLFLTCDLHCSLVCCYRI
jgi:hypothetical protein